MTGYERAVVKQLPGGGYLVLAGLLCGEFAVRQSKESRHGLPAVQEPDGLSVEYGP
jgi:hypothetical protein